MASKKPATIKATKNKNNSGENDLQILNPNQKITLAGKDITVREYGFVEGLSVRVKAKSFIEDIYELTLAGDIPVESIIHLLAKHHLTLLPLVAQSSDLSLDFVKSLNDIDGNKLLYLWWEVNGPFFVRRVMELVKAQQNQGNLQLAGQMFMQSLLQQGMMQTESAATPKDS